MLTNYFCDLSYLAEKNEDKVYVNQDESLTDLQHKHWFHFFWIFFMNL